MLTVFSFNRATKEDGVEIFFQTQLTAKVALAFSLASLILQERCLVGAPDFLLSLAHLNDLVLHG